MPFVCLIMRKGLVTAKAKWPVAYCFALLSNIAEFYEFESQSKLIIY